MKVIILLAFGIFSTFFVRSALPHWSTSFNYVEFITVKCLVIVTILIPSTIYFLKNPLLFIQKKTLNRTYRIYLLLGTILFFVLPHLIGSSKPILVPQIVVSTLFYTTILAYYEELTFRYFFTEANYKRFNILRIQLLSSAVFALAHSANIFYSGSLIQTSFQICYAFGFGMLLYAVYVRTNSLVLSTAVHTIVNLPGTYIDNVSSNNKMIIYKLSEIHFEIQPDVILGIFVAAILWYISRLILTPPFAKTITILPK
jgi:membrane protease YdiL (CAAX protease family)